MNEEGAVQRYLLDYLGSDTTLMGLVNGVTLKSVPATLPFPIVKIDKLDGDDLMVVGLHRVWNDLVYNIRGAVHWKGGGEPDWTDSEAIANQIDALMHDHEEITSELEVHSFREESFSDETLEGKDVVLYLGGIYRLRARAL